MKATIYSDGDRSVGIQPYGITIEIGIESIDDSEDRESIREKLADCFGEIWDDKAHVEFEDEHL